MGNMSTQALRYGGGLNDYQHYMASYLDVTMYLKYTPKMILANIEAYNLGTWQGLCFGARFSGLSEKLQFGSIIAIMTRPHILEVDVVSRQLLQIYLEITLGMIEADWGSWQ